jgi:hypothetical protein
LPSSSSYPTKGTRAIAHKELRMPSILSLDTICNSATYFVGQWSPDLKRNQSRDLLRLVLSKMYCPSQGNLFHARIRASHAALAATLDLSREWTCKLVGCLREARWLETSAPRLPDGKQEISIFRPGRRLKKLLVMLLRSKQRVKSRVNDQLQKIPTEEEVAKNLQFLRDLQKELGEKLAMKKEMRR